MSTRDLKSSQLTELLLKVSTRTVEMNMETYDGLSESGWISGALLFISFILVLIHLNNLRMATKDGSKNFENNLCGVQSQISHVL